MSGITFEREKPRFLPQFSFTFFTREVYARARARNFGCNIPDLIKPERLLGEECDEMR